MAPDEGHVVGFRGRDEHATVRCWAVLCLWLLCGSAWAAADVVAFDLPAQPLESALEDFSVVTGWSVMYSARLAQGRHSHAVLGQRSPAHALEELLTGTGLQADSAGDGRIVLREAAPSSPQPDDVAHAPSDPAQLRHYAALQQSLRDVFCRDAVIAPGDYSARIALSVGHTGVVSRVDVLDGSGDARRDQRLIDALTAVRLPPATSALAQPVLLEVRPTTLRRDCGR